jgi:FKBP-type peptidyl-prolyl cis-trans isomerase FkpA
MSYDKIMADKIKIEEIEKGEGQVLKDGDLAVVHYEGWLYDPNEEGNVGANFDSSYDRDEPFEVRIGGGYVIKGWDMGLPGMKVGGRRRLVIPPELGYGRYGVDPDIPGDSTLIFEIELLKIK